MRRIDKYDLNTVEGIKKLLTLSNEMDCTTICDDKNCSEYAESETIDDVLYCMARHLLEEIPTKKVRRWETYDGDFVKAENDFDDYMEKWTIRSPKTFGQWLMEEVEVEEC